MAFPESRKLGAGSGGASRRAKAGGLDLTVKGRDLRNSRGAASLMENEIVMRKKLEALQGGCIPHYRGSMGRGILKLMARDCADGATFNKDADEDGRLLSLASSQLQKIHKLGAARGDIRSSSIAVKRSSGQAALIDLGLSEIAGNAELFRHEMEALQDLAK